MARKTAELAPEVIAQAQELARERGKPVRVYEEPAAAIGPFVVPALAILADNQEWTEEDLGSFEIRCRAIVWPNGLIS